MRLLLLLVLLLLVLCAACKDSRPEVADAAPVQVLPPDNDGGESSSDAKPEQPRKGRPSSGSECVVTTPLECVLCPAGEICFTQLTCGPTPPTGASCIERPGRPGDNRCHRECRTNTDCADGEDCFHEVFTACTDYNGGAEGRGICCSIGGCAPSD